MAGFTTRPKLSVIEATRAPMRPGNWRVRLACGHEQWVVSRKKPSGKFVCEDATCPVTGGSSR